MRLGENAKNMVIEGHKFIGGQGCSGKKTSLKNHKKQQIPKYK